MTAVFIVPCAAEKIDVAAPARALYASDNFQYILAGAEAEAAAHARDMGEGAKVMILSAKYGLLDLDQVVAPYDVKMTDHTGTVTVAALADQLREVAPTSVTTMLPKAYAERLEAAVAVINDDEDGELWISHYDAYETAPGIGFHRGVSARLTRVAAIEFDLAA